LLGEQVGSYQRATSQEAGGSSKNPCGSTGIGIFGLSAQTQRQNGNVSHGGGVSLLDVYDGEYQHKSANDRDEGFLGLNLGLIVGADWGIETNVQLGLTWGN
jgi:hypothetical protein